MSDTYDPSTHLWRVTLKQGGWCDAGKHTIPQGASYEKSDTVGNTCTVCMAEATTDPAVAGSWE